MKSYLSKLSFPLMFLILFSCQFEGKDYKIEKVYTDKKATLKARIRIVPIEAVEDFLLEVSLEDSIGETSVTIAE